MVARANLIFGLHVHVAIEDDEARIQIMNAVRYFLPHIFALSVNSPFWLGVDTGWKSYRAKVFERFPRTGIPGSTSARSRFKEFVDTADRDRLHQRRQENLVGRPRPSVLPDARVPDLRRQMRVDETICLAALFQAVTYKLWTLYNRNQGWRLYRRSLINENKWRAARFGLDGKLIDLGKRIEVPTRGAARRAARVHRRRCRRARLARGNGLRPRDRAAPDRRRPPARGLRAHAKPAGGRRVHHRRDRSRGAGCLTRRSRSCASNGGRIFRRPTRGRSTSPSST